MSQQFTVKYATLPEFPGYRFGDDGSVWSRWKRINLGWRYGSRYELGDLWHQLQPGIGEKGHLLVTLCVGGKRFTRPVHRLILEAFVGPRPPGMQCRHFPDRNPANNRLDNIQWGTPTDNQADRVVHGTDCRGEKHPMAVLTEDIVRQIRADFAAECTAGRKYGAITRVAAKHGISKGASQSVIRFATWKHLH